MTDGTLIEAALRRGRTRTVCVLTPVEIRAILRRWGGTRTVVEAMVREARRDARLLLRTLVAKIRR